MAIKIKIIKYVRNENKYRIFNNENCVRLIFEVLSRAFFNIGKKYKNYSFLPRLIGLGLYPSTYYIVKLADKRAKINMDVVPWLKLYVWELLSR